MYGATSTWHALMAKLADIAGTYLQIQVAAGVSAVQLFDSWVGTLSAADYEQYVLPHSQRVLSAVEGVPRFHFGVGTGELLGLMRTAGADVVGVDWRVPLDEAATRVGSDGVLQGNLDPALCLAPWEVVSERALDVIARGKSAKAHIFNLGHGVLPTTNPDVLERLVDLVHEPE
jgi:uroporphyrinogen decarboxylase